MIKKLWRKVTPVPQEMNGNGYLWVCAHCGKAIASVYDYPKRKECPNCGADIRGDKENE